jgi:hypothetical protein
MSELTLLEQSKNITNPQAQEVANVFALEYPVMGLLPFEQISGFHKPFTIMDELPTVAPRDFGADFTSDYGKGSNYNVPWKNYGGKLEVDKALRKGNPAGAAMQELMQIQANAKKWAADVLQGAGGTSITGVKTFLSSFYTGQVIDAGTTAHGDLLTMAMMDDLMDLVDIDSNTALFCTKKVRNRLTYLARTNASGQQNVQYDVDQFGSKVMHYNKVPLYVMLDSYDGTNIQSVTEVDGATSNNDTSSVYLVKFGAQAVKGFSPDSAVMQIDVANPGTHLAITRFEMNAGIAQMQPRAAGRIRFVKESVT